MLLATIVALPSGLIQGYAGFGGALIATPFFAVLYGAVKGLAIILFIVLFGQGAHFIIASKKADWRKVGPVSHTSAANLSFGFYSWFQLTQKSYGKEWLYLFYL